MDPAEGVTHRPPRRAGPARRKPAPPPSPVVRNLPAEAQTAEGRRQMLVDYCRTIGARLAALNGAPAKAGPATAPPVEPKLSPRMRQTLHRLLAGDGEKQIARQLGVSPHTVHVYVKAVYRRFKVSSRGELFAQFVSLPSGPTSGRLTG